MQEPSASQLIKRLLAVFGFGIAAAIGVAIFFIYFFSPSGSYPISDLLLDPQVAKGMHYETERQRFVFDHIELLHYSKSRGKWETEKLNLDQYQKIYSIIRSDKSETVLDETVKNAFYQENPAILSIVVKNTATGLEQVFQEMQISTDKGVYRVKLREGDALPQWAYFIHEGIYQKVLDTLGIY